MKTNLSAYNNKVCEETQENTTRIGKGKGKGKAVLVLN
jgi:hypothetical protein